jgi:hypothetical protein
LETGKDHMEQCVTSDGKYYEERNTQIQWFHL